LAWNSDTVSVLCLECLWVVVDLKRRYKNSLKELINNNNLLEHAGNRVPKNCIKYYKYDTKCIESRLNHIVNFTNFIHILNTFPTCKRPLQLGLPIMQSDSLYHQIHHLETVKHKWLATDSRQFHT